MIEEQRFDPFSEKQQKGDELLRRSLVYERAKTRMEIAAQRITHERKKHIDEIAVTGEPFDQSFDVAIEELRSAKHRLGAKADELWKQMEECTEKFGPGLQRLANAVLTAAANDYEAALCGEFYDSEAEIRLIEKFAECGAEAYTTTDFKTVLERIRRVYREEWLPTVKKLIPALQAEKREKYGTSHKCPLCGGGLYYVKCKGQNDTVRCTTCSLFYRVKKESRCKA